jgi:methionine-gamma-lyase
MAHGSKKRTPYLVRPPTIRPTTAVLTRGFNPELSVGSARPAVFRSSTYVFSSPEAAERAFAVALGRSKASEDDNVELIYSRLSHPNAEILEDQILPLEKGAEAAAVFNSGMAAISTVFLTVCPPGSSFVYTTPVYGGTHHLIHQLLEPLGIRGIPVPAASTEKLAAAIAGAPNLRFVYVETPANPTLVMCDIAAAVAAAKSVGGSQPPLVGVDNTFLGPVFQHPLALGADITLYSATKYLAGHSDMLGGVVLGKDQDLIATFRGMRAILGNILQPDECWLLNSRLPTVELRMTRQSKNAQRIAEALAGHHRVERVHYPTHFTDPEQVRIRDAQCDFPGAVFSLELRGGKRAAFDFLRHLKIVRDAVSLGGVESLACHPATTTHSEMSEEELLAAGIADSLVRISIGVEDRRDLLNDIRVALDSL